jgi:hypothetical protein
MDFAVILSLSDGLERTARLTAWVQSFYEPGTEPVLVGGGAVELFTAGAYTTGDLDLVGAVPTAVASALKEAGFVRRGRHWIHEAGQVFLEFPGVALEEGERSIRLRIGDCDVTVIAPEDLLAERLAAWQYWRSIVDGVNAGLILRAQGERLDWERVRLRCSDRGAERAFVVLQEFSSRRGIAEPSASEVLQWAQRGVE